MAAYLKFTYAGRRDVDFAAALALAPMLLALVPISRLAPAATPARDIALCLGVGAVWGLGAAVARWLTVRLVATRLVAGDDGAPRGRAVVLPPRWHAAIARWGSVPRALALRWAADAGAAAGLFLAHALMAQGVSHLGVESLWAVAPLSAAALGVLSRARWWQRHMAIEALLALGVPLSAAQGEAGAPAVQAPYRVPFVGNCFPGERPNLFGPRDLEAPALAAALSRWGVSVEQRQNFGVRAVALGLYAVLLHDALRPHGQQAQPMGPVALLFLPACYLLHRLRTYDLVRFWRGRIA